MNTNNEQLNDDWYWTGTVTADHDIRIASQRIADFFWPYDCATERDEIKCEIRKIIAESFRKTAGHDPVSQANRKMRLKNLAMTRKARTGRAARSNN